MDISLNYIYQLLMGGLTAIYVTCAWVLWNGGWNAKGTPAKKITHFQKIISFLYIFTAINVIYMAIINPCTELSPKWKLLNGLYCLFNLGFLPLVQPILRRSKIRVKHVIAIYFPHLVQAICILLWGNAYCKELTISHYSILVYIIVMYAIEMIKLRKWDKRLMNEYSDVEHKNTLWFRRLSLFFMAMLLLWIPADLSPTYSDILWIIYFIIEIIVILKITTYALTQEEVDERMEHIIMDPDEGKISVLGVSLECDNESYISCNETNRNSNDTDNSFNEPIWARKLELIMNEKEVFCKQGLTREELARELGVNRTYLSNYIKEKTGGSYYNFINGFRLNKAVKQLVESNENIETIAANCGFSSSAFFSRTFREQYKMSPTEYRKSYRQLVHANDIR